MFRPSSEDALHGPWTQAGSESEDAANIICPYNGQRIVGLIAAAFHDGINYLDVRPWKPSVLSHQGLLGKIVIACMRA